MVETENSRCRRRRKVQAGPFRDLTSAEEAILLSRLFKAEAGRDPSRGPFRPYAVLAVMQTAGVAYWRARRRQERSVSHAQRRKRLLELARRATDTKHAVTSIKVIEVYELLGADRAAGPIAEIEQMHKLPRAELKAFLERCAAELDGLYPPHQPRLDQALERFVLAVREAIQSFTNIDVSQPAESLNPRRDPGDPADWGAFHRIVRTALHIVDPDRPAGWVLLNAVRRRGRGVGPVRNARLAQQRQRKSPNPVQ
jgi:hypothetical protein